MRHLVKFNTTVAGNFSNSTCISTLPCTDHKLIENYLYVGDRQYTIILFISHTFLPTILNYLNDRKRGRHYLLYDFSAPDATMLNYLNDRERGRHYLL